jgi:hypothetical protein
MSSSTGIHSQVRLGSRLFLLLAPHVGILWDPRITDLGRVRGCILEEEKVEFEDHFLIYKMGVKIVAILECF